MKRKILLDKVKPGISLSLSLSLTHTYTRTYTHMNKTENVLLFILSCFPCMGTSIFFSELKEYKTVCNTNHFR